MKQHSTIMQSKGLIPGSRREADKQHTDRFRSMRKDSSHVRHFNLAVLR